MTASRPLAVKGDFPLAQVTFLEHLQIPRVLLVRGKISGIAAERSEHAMTCAWVVLEASDLRLTAGATSPHKQVIMLRVLSPVTAPAMQLLRKVWAAWRQEMWALPGTYPRLWHV
jgi:urease accessory protein